MFSLERAKILANICCATYESKPISSDYAQSLRDNDLIKFTDYNVPVKVLLGFIDEELIIAFEGTVLANINQETDIFLNMVICMFCNFLPVLRLPQKSLNSLIDEQQIKEIYGGEIHLGFALLMEEILPKIQSEIKQLKPKTICLTGHSLGGALATLAAYRLRKQGFSIPISIYTFGAPRVGDSAFASKYEDSKVLHFRIENQNDIVPHLPPNSQTQSKIPILNILNRLQNLDLPILDKLSNLPIPNLDYPPVGILKFINWDKKIVEDSDSLRQKRLSRFHKSLFKIHNSKILLDHDIKSYFQELNHCSIEQRKEIFMQDSELEKIVYNVMVIGKTGVGKSALINYLYDQNIANTGVGKPVTIKFDKYNFTWKGIPINIYDSWGLEVDKAPEWRKTLDDELKEHGTDRPVSEWFHTIFYCINAQSSRIEPFEFEIIQDLITDKYRVIVVLTKAESMSPDDLSILSNCIRKEVLSEIPIIEVCSIIKETRTGKTKTFGRNELQKQTLRGFWNGITVRLPDRCESVLHKEVDKWCGEQKKILDLTKGDRWYMLHKSKIMGEIKNNYNEFFNKLRDTRYKIVVGEVKKIVNYYKQLATILEYPPPEDLPVFTLENEELIKKNLFQKIASWLEEAQQAHFQAIGKFIHALLPDTRPELQSRIDEICEQLKAEISKQKPEISNIIKNIRKDTP
ncbi:50S ribosome-binding GTPase [Plectonema radiosum NIES-515]|uniref:50S ribosome-binding GTPase n=1 Tax=Plectonema radiosum NIES-515 TaxID=2986073 RepID=A0ABT3AUF9_9CYAN|nr:GTPase [Plectonema radiosum]MCV3212761.1 50S ribosome-binding GTPase [Plectonema radiosum NIES-515]